MQTIMAYLRISDFCLARLYPDSSAWWKDRSEVMGDFVLYNVQCKLSLSLPYFEHFATSTMYDTYFG